MFNLVRNNSSIISKFTQYKFYNLYKNQIIPYNKKSFNFYSNSLISLKSGNIKINIDDGNDNFFSITIKKPNNYLLEINNNINYNIISNNNNSKLLIYYNDDYFENMISYYNHTEFNIKMMNMC
tara:strand:+ start:2531 stop:2902 length:372 start_codon:yes stop_codon:yes gene_type:complete